MTIPDRDYKKNQLVLKEHQENYFTKNKLPKEIEINNISKEYLIKTLKFIKNKDVNIIFIKNPRHDFINKNITEKYENLNK